MVINKRKPRLAYICAILACIVIHAMCTESAEYARLLNNKRERIPEHENTQETYMMHPLQTKRTKNKTKRRIAQHTEIDIEAVPIIDTEASNVVNDNIETYSLYSNIVFLATALYSIFSIRSWLVYRIENIAEQKQMIAICIIGAVLIGAVFINELIIWYTEDNKNDKGTKRHKMCMPVFSILTFALLVYGSHHNLVATWTEQKNSKKGVDLTACTICLIVTICQVLATAMRQNEYESILPTLTALMPYTVLYIIRVHCDYITALIYYIMYLVVSLIMIAQLISVTDSKCKRLNVHKTLCIIAIEITVLISVWIICAIV